MKLNFFLLLLTFLTAITLTSATDLTPETVRGSVIIHNWTNNFRFEAQDKGFTWGRMCQDGGSIPDVEPNQTTNVCTQGRDGSPSGFTGWFKYRIRKIDSNELIGEFTVNFDCPYIVGNSASIDTKSYTAIYKINPSYDISQNDFTYAVSVSA